MDFELPTALLDAGGWVFASVVLASVLIMVRRGDIVPGWVYRREVERADKATAQVDLQTESIKALTDQFEGFASLAASFMAVRRRGKGQGAP